MSFDCKFHDHVLSGMLHNQVVQYKETKFLACISKGVITSASNIRQGVQESEKEEDVLAYIICIGCQKHLGLSASIWMVAT